MTLKSEAKFEGKLTCAFKKMRNLASFHRLKNSDFTLESKMVGLNQNKNSKQLDRPDAVKKKKKKKKNSTSNSTINKFFYTCSTKSSFLRYKKAAKIGGFVQCLVHIFLGHDDCF